MKIQKHSVFDTYKYPKGPASDMSPDSIVSLITIERDECVIVDAYVGELAQGDRYCLERNVVNSNDRMMEAIDLITAKQIDVVHLRSGIVLLETDEKSVEIETCDGRPLGIFIANAIIRHFGGDQ